MLGVKTIGYIVFILQKGSLNSYENKRYWTTALFSLAYGHYKTNDFKND